jgi:zinc/manganese transport system ATP-binding protein
MTAVLSVQNATLQFDDRAIWQGLDFAIQPGEFIALIGANGSGKSMLLKSILGQHRSADSQLPLRVFDSVRLGLDGHRFGLPLSSKKTRALVLAALERVDALDLADKPIVELSGGEMQRVRVAQAIISKPKLILADEPLSALDLNHQQVVSGLIADQAKKQGSAVLFVTHDLNPIADYVDRVLYLAQGRYEIGTTDEVMQSEVLSNLYGTEIDVVRNQGRIVVLGAHDHNHHDDEKWM